MSTPCVDKSPVAQQQVTAEALARSIVDLVSLPDVYLKVKKCLDDPDSSLSDIADIVSVDPSLTARILRVANSAFYAFPSNIDKVSLAINLIGTQQVHDFVLATSVVQSFSGIPRELVDMKRFWQTSVLCGASAKVIAEECGIRHSEHLFTVGLLAHVGRLVLYLRLPDVIRAVSQGDQKDTLMHEALRRALGFDDAAVAAELLACWNLPATLVEPIRLHTQPHGDGEYALHAAIVHVASVFADAAGQELHELVQHLDDCVWSVVGLDAESIERLRIGGEELAAEMMNKLLPEQS